MTKSMTAYGRFSFSLLNHKFTFEVHSLNRKSLDLSIFLPKDMFFLDIEIRKWVKTHVSRGQVTVRLTKDISTEDLESILPEQSVLKELKTSWEKLADSTGFSSENISLSFALEQYEKLCKFDEKTIHEHLSEIRKAFDQTIDIFIQMKKVEGEALKKDILSRVESIEALSQTIETLAKDEPVDFKAKLEQKIAKLGNLCEDNDEKIAREVVIFADKVDISEEISRIKSHITQFRSRFESEEQSIGKALDFLVLELNRETNTILAKTSLIKVTNEALCIKSELEKIREQVQNIE